jgi:hypothetical protein
LFRVHSIARSGQTRRMEDDSEEAINRVLQSERAAGEMRELCQSEATALLEQARSRAQRIQERADMRTGKLRAACEAHGAAKVAALERVARELRAQPGNEDERRSRLGVAVERLAAAITGEAPDAA